MFHSLAGAVWFLTAPSHLLLWLVLAAAVAQLAGWRRSACWSTLAAALLFLCAAVIPLWVWPARALEDRFPRPAWPARVDGILVLGGGLDTVMLRARGIPRPEQSEARLVAGLEAARRYRRAVLVFSGGGPSGDGRLSESVTAGHVFAQMGADPHRLLLESRAHDTYENILFSRRLANPRRGQVWLLVTSALHMPRAMITASALGWKMVPWPSDYRTLPDGIEYRFSPIWNLDGTDATVHEWLGLLAYRLRPHSVGG